MTNTKRPPGAKFESTSDKLPRISIKNGYFLANDGTRLFYSVEGKGKPLVFVYGLVCSSLHWTYQIEHFRNHYQTIWFDYRGHNHSQTPKDLSSLSVHQMAADLGDLIEELNISEAVFLGHSMGVNVLLELYRQRPEYVRGLVLANGTPRRPFETIFKTNATELVFKGLRKANQIAPWLVQKLWHAQKSSFLAKRLIGLGGFNTHLSSSGDVDLYVEKIAEMEPAVFVELIKNYENYDATPWLDSINAETLLISGKNDLITPPKQQDLMHQLMPKSRLERIRHGSHCSQMDLPELINVKIQHFLDEIGWKP